MQEHVQENKRPSPNQIRLGRLGQLGAGPQVGLKPFGDDLPKKL